MSGASLSGRKPTENPPRAVVFGCAGTRLGADERAFFAAADPLGFILFRRNCDTPDQLRALVAALREAVGRDDAPVLIDQEGGRVARLRPPRWPAHPPARRIGQLYEHDPVKGREAAWLNARLLADMLLSLGITVDCAPVCDVPAPDGHDVIGDRAFGVDPALVADLARVSCQGFIDGGVLPVIKHIPGHGRARVDSHEELPVVEAGLDDLERMDFAPFRALADLPLGMVAHVVYRALDPGRAASVSGRIIDEVVRRRLGFDGVLFSDDLSMQALSGTMGERARAVLAAGCDVVLHCNGRHAEMMAVAEATPVLGAASAARWARAQALVKPDQEARPEVDTVALRARLDDLLQAPASIV